MARLFSERDQKKIEAAIAGAEAQTAAEVVPCVVAQSDEYDEADLRAAIAGGLLPAALLLAARNFTDLWISINALEIVLFVLAGMAAGWAASALIPPVRRLFAGRRLMERRVGQRAAEAFIAEEVFATRDRTGILIFLSMLERRVLVIGDSGINARVEKGAWDAVVARITQGIRSGSPADGLVAGLAMCGDLLRTHGVARKPDDSNELPDRLRTGK